MIDQAEPPVHATQWEGHDKTDQQYQARGCGHSKVKRHAGTKLGPFERKEVVLAFLNVLMVQSEQNVI